MPYEFGYCTGGRFVNGEYVPVSIPCLYTSELMYDFDTSVPRTVEAKSKANKFLEEYADKFLDISTLGGNAGQKYVTFIPNLNSMPCLALAEDPENEFLSPKDVPSTIISCWKEPANPGLGSHTIGGYMHDIQLAPSSLVVNDSGVKVIMWDSRYAEQTTATKVALVIFRGKVTGHTRYCYMWVLYNNTTEKWITEEDGHYGLKTPVFTSTEDYPLITPSEASPALDHKSFMAGWLMGQRIAKQLTGKVPASSLILPTISGNEYRYNMKDVPVVDVNIKEV